MTQESDDRPLDELPQQDLSVLGPGPLATEPEDHDDPDGATYPADARDDDLEHVEDQPEQPPILQRRTVSEALVFSKNARIAADQQLNDTIKRARAAGATLAQIGGVLGMSPTHVGEREKRSSIEVTAEPPSPLDFPLP